MTGESRVVAVDTQDNVWQEELEGGGWTGGRELNGESAAGGPCLARTARWLAVDTEAALQLD